MKLAICASLDFTQEMKEIATELEKLGHSFFMPKTAGLILNGEISLDQIKKEKESGQIHKRMQSHDILRYYFEKIKKADAVLVLNLDKKGIKNYIGGNTFLEMGFAHVLGKKIFLLNEVPDMAYSDEIRAMKPTVINTELEKIE